MVGPALLALFVAPVVLGGMAKLGQMAAAGLGYKAVVGRNGYPVGESPFSKRYNDAGVKIDLASASELGKKIALLEQVFEPLHKFLGRTYHFTMTEGAFLNDLVNVASATNERVKQTGRDLLDLQQQLQQLQQQGVPETQLEQFSPQVEALLARQKEAREAFTLAATPIAKYLDEKELRQHQYPL